MKKKNSILIILLSLFSLTSCTKIEDREYSSYTLYYKDFAEVDGHRFKYLKKEASKELGEKVYKLYKNLIESNESNQDLNKSIGFEDVGYYIFTFKNEDYVDRIGFSKDSNDVEVYYQKSTFKSSINRIYKKLSGGYLEDVNEFKTTFKELLKDSEWCYLDNGYNS